LLKKAEKLILPGIGAYKHKVKCRTSEEKGSINLHLEGKILMYRQAQYIPLELEVFELPSSGTYIPQVHGRQ
jgi:hypothetical protein